MTNKSRSIKNFIAGILVGMLLIVTISASFLGINMAQLGRTAQIILLIKSESLVEVDNRQLLEGAMKGLVGSLKDPYSAYLDAKEYEQLETQMEGSYGGIGIYVGMREDNRLTVISPIKGTPADKAGVLAGDIIMKIDQVETLDMDMDVAVSMMKGKEGTDVVISVLREGNSQLMDIKITREIINIPSVEGQMLEEEPAIAYVDIVSFAHNTPSDLAELLADLAKENFKGMIIDLRNNPGGSLQAAVEVADFFVPEGPIVHIVDNRRSEEFTASGKALKVPLVVLVNEGSASASEILAGAIKDSSAGTIVGTTTFGKGIVQSVFTLNSGTALKLTTAKYLTPDMHDIDKKGIEPDVVVELDREGGTDNQLEKAIEVLKAKF